MSHSSSKSEKESTYRVTFHQWVIEGYHIWERERFTHFQSMDLRERKIRSLDEGKKKGLLTKEQERNNKSGCFPLKSEKGEIYLGKAKKSLSFKV